MTEKKQAQLITITCKIHESQNNSINNIGYGANRAENIRIALDLLLSCDNAQIPLPQLKDAISSGQLFEFLTNTDGGQ